MGNEYFKFKKFTIRQDKCAMKVGTDGVLLGAWTNTENASRIADIGTGTGLIAIMLAQKSEALITGIEIDGEAAMQAMENMDSTEWRDRLLVINADINDFYTNHEGEYDLIVSNPPFFKEDTKGHHEKRNMARHTDILDFNTLTRAASFMLSEGGALCVILPATSSAEFIAEALKYRLYLSHKTEVTTKPGATPKRVMLRFKKGHSEEYTEFSQLLLSENGEKSKEYLSLTSEYYL